MALRRIDYQKRYSQVNAFDEKEELSPQSPGQAEVITPSQTGVGPSVAPLALPARRFHSRLYRPWGHPS